MISSATAAKVTKFEQERLDAELQWMADKKYNMYLFVMLILVSKKEMLRSLSLSLN